MPPQVQEALFRLKQGETTMVETPDGFVVVRLAEIADPDPATDPAGRGADPRGAHPRASTRTSRSCSPPRCATARSPRVNRTLLDSLTE